MAKILDRYVIKQGATLPAFTRTLKTRTSAGVETPIDLTGATSVSFIYSEQDGDEPDQSTSVTRSVTVTDASNGVVVFAPVAGDTAAVGQFYGEFYAVLASGDPIRVPSDKGEYIEFCVVKNVGGP